MKKVLVTGATGFIGNYVVQQLLNMGCRVVATSISEAKARNHEWFSQVKYIPFNFAQFDDNLNYYDFFDKPDLVIHLAWEGLPNYKSLFHFEENLPVQYSFLKNLVTHGAKDVTVTGTCFEYGMKEGLLREDMCAEPANPYALAKDSLRRFMQELQKLQGFQFKWIRLFYMYGKGQNPNSLLSQLERAVANGDEIFNMSGGQQVRDYLPVEKVAEYVVKTALQNNITGIVNCCGGHPVTVQQFVENYLKTRFLNIKLNLGFYPYADYEPMAFWGDNEKLKTILNNE
jgi:nucleoside-diphosphate-sugar epimerase